MTSAGKTGTAQVISQPGAEGRGGTRQDDLRDHGWFVFFAPRDNPEIAGVIFAEHARARLSGRADRQVTSSTTYFAKKDGAAAAGVHRAEIRSCRLKDPVEPDARRAARTGGG